MSAAMWAAVAGLGGVAAVLRSLAVSAGQRWPGGTAAAVTVVNLVGALTLGLVAGAGVTGDARILAGTALLGSFTTFSAWMAEADELRRDGAPWAAALLVVAALLLGLGAVALGRALA